MRHLSHSDRRPRVLIADDHAVVAECLSSILQNSCDVIGIVGDGRELLVEAPKLEPDLIVLDIGMPVLNGIDAAEQLNRFLPNVKFVFLTMQDDSNVAAAALNLGKVGYVLKHSLSTELLLAVSEVLQGKTYVTPRLWSVQGERARQFSKELTPRQREVLQLLAEGRPMKEVAQILNISEKAIMFHKYRIMALFNLKNNSELVLFALKQSLISSR